MAASVLLCASVVYSPTYRDVRHACDGLQAELLLRPVNEMLDVGRACVRKTLQVFLKFRHIFVRSKRPIEVRIAGQTAVRPIVFEGSSLEVRL